MTAIAWWLSIPIIATLIAIVWTIWASRPKPPADTHETLLSHQRFRAAMENDTFGAKRPTGSTGETERPAKQPTKQPGRDE